MQKSSCPVVVASVQLCMSEVLLLEPPEQLVESPYSFKVLAILQTGHSLVVEADKVFVDI